VEDVIGVVVPAHAEMRVILQLQVQLVDEAPFYQLHHSLLLLAAAPACLHELPLLVLECGEPAVLDFGVGVAGNGCFLYFSEAGELALEEGLPALLDGHVEQVLAVGLDLVLHVVDDLLSDSPLVLVLEIALAVFFYSAVVQYLPLQGRFL
jgi:hypothetical protein